LNTFPCEINFAYNDQSPFRRLQISDPKVLYPSSLLMHAEDSVGMSSEELTAKNYLNSGGRSVLLISQKA